MEIRWAVILSPYYQKHINQSNLKFADAVFIGRTMTEINNFGKIVGIIRANDVPE